MPLGRNPFQGTPPATVPRGRRNRASLPRHGNRPEELTCPFKIHNLAKERRRIHAYQTVQKNLPVTVVTLIALGIMFFLFFMHPHSPEESLEFYTPDGNGVGSFRVDITEVLADPAYTEIKIVPEDMESFHRFMDKFRNRSVTAKSRNGEAMPSFRAGTSRMTESCALPGIDAHSFSRRKRREQGIHDSGRISGQGGRKRDVLVPVPGAINHAGWIFHAHGFRQTAFSCVKRSLPRSMIGIPALPAYREPSFLSSRSLPHLRARMEQTINWSWWKIMMGMTSRPMGEPAKSRSSSGCR